MAKGGYRNHSGAKPKPHELKVLEGTWRADRHGNEPDVPAIWPDPPSYLPMTERQRQIWDSLKDRDCWHAESDWPAIWGFVKTVDELIRNIEAQDETETSGHPLTFKHIIKHVVDESGRPVELEIVSPEANPLKVEARKFLDHLYKFSSVNGFTPVDRAKMPKSLGEIDSSNPLERFLKKAQ